MKKLVKFVATIVALTLIGIPAIKVVVRTVLADEPITTVQNTKEAVSLTEATETTTTASTADNAVGVDTSASAEVKDQTTTSSGSNVQLDENGKYTPNYKSINSKEDLDKMWDEAESNPSQFGGKGRVPEEPTPSEPSKPSEPSEPSEPEPSKPSEPSEPSEPTPSKPEEPKSSASSAESKEVKETKKPLPTAGLPVTGEEKIVDYAMMATGFIILLFTMRYTTIVAFIKGKYKI